jgi:hypothetical protein
MKIKFSWGSGIAATYIGFVLATLVMVVIFMKQDVTLETKDYYAKGLAYQEQIEKMNRAKNLSEQLEITSLQNSIKLSFPKIFSAESLMGTVTLYRPANDKNDFTIHVSTDTSRIQLIPTENMSKGLWKVRVDWSADDVTYFNETPIMVN